MLDMPVATPLSSAVGVLVENFDVQSEPGAEACDALRRLLAQHHLILFRNVELTPADNRRFLQIFGPVRDEFVDGKFYSLVQNRVSPDSEEGEELMYHCDYSFLPNPLKVVSLYGMDIPGECATTKFANGVRACREMPAHLAARLQGKMVLHASDVTPLSVTSSGRLSPEDLETRQYSGTLHPAILTHPVTGDRVLFFNEYLCVRIEGMSRTESDALISDALAYMHAPKHVYEHRWRQGDFIVFDNIALTHKREKGAPRILRRMIIQ